MLQLPVELLQECFVHVGAAENISAKDWAALTIVCSAQSSSILVTTLMSLAERLRPLALSHLYRNIGKEHLADPAFGKAIKSHPQRASLVREVSWQLNQRSRSTQSSTRHQKNIQAAVDILPRLSDLDRLYIVCGEGRDVRAEDLPTPEQLRKCRPESLRRLSLSAEDYGFVLDEHIWRLFQHFAGLPHIQALDVTGEWETGSVPEDVAPLWHGIRTLSLAGVSSISDNDGTPSFTLIQILSACPSIRQLSIDFYTAQDGLRQVFEAFLSDDRLCARLEELQVNNISLTDSVEIFSISDRLPSLRLLTLSFEVQQHSVNRIVLRDEDELLGAACDDLVDTISALFPEEQICHHLSHLDIDVKLPLAYLHTPELPNVLDRFTKRTSFPALTCLSFACQSGMVNFREHLIEPLMLDGRHKKHFHRLIAEAPDGLRVKYELGFANPYDVSEGALKSLSYSGGNVEEKYWYRQAG